MSLRPMPTSLPVGCQTDTGICDLQGQCILGRVPQAHGDLSRRVVREGMLVGVGHELVRKQRQRNGLVDRQRYRIGA